MDNDAHSSPDEMEPNALDHSTQTQNSLRSMFHSVVRECYANGVNIRDEELTGYVADILTDFTMADKVYSIRDSNGKPFHSISEMLAASDPVFGTAWSFTREREVRKHIGDFSLFFSGLFPEALHRSRRAVDPVSDSLLHMMRAGKESYYVVSQFNVFEYAQEAPLFEKLTAQFEGCVFGLHLVRSELDKRNPGSPFKALQQKRLM